MKTRSLLSSVLLIAVSVFFSLTSQTLHSQPINNTPCEAPIILPNGSVVTYTNIGATADVGEVIPPAGSVVGSTCLSQDGWCSFSLTLENSVWFKFIAPPSGNVTISTCNEGTTIDSQIALYTVESCFDYVTFDLIGANDDLSGCAQNLASSITACVVPGIIYYIQVDGFDGDAGDFSLSVTSGPDSECIDCPLLGEDVGTPCDDGDSDSIDDVITSECVCQGIQPCLNTIPYTTWNFDGSNQVLSSLCTYEEEYNTFNDAEEGSTYTFTSEDDGEAGFITVRSGTFDGPVLGFGYSPLTVTSDINGSLFAHYNVNGACDADFVCVDITTQCISCPVYCPILDLTAGDPCDDGDPSTINDAITSDCDCHGEQECLQDFLWDIESFDGSDVQLITNSNIPGDYNTYNNSEVGHQYTFTTSNTSTPSFITVTSGTYNGDVLGFGFSPLTVTSDIDGPLFAHYSSNGICETLGGPFDSYAQCITCPHYCEELDLLEGDPCDDGDPDTNFDRITEDCGCAGNLPCLMDFLWVSTTLPGTSEIITVATANLTGDYNVINNAFSGDQYTFTASFTTEEPAYMTIRSGTYDGPVLGSGYSPITVTSDVDGALFVHFTDNEFCDDFVSGGITNTVQCITCNYDCPPIGADYGDACDDGNAATSGDVIQDDCSCMGYIPPANDLCSNATTLIVNDPGECPANQVTGTTLGASFDGADFVCDSGGEWVDVFYTFNSGNYNTVRIDLAGITQMDIVIGISSGCSESSFICQFGISFIQFSVTPNTDYIIQTGPNLAFSGPGTFNICVSGVYDCPVLEANIGDACDDGDANTINDVVTAECTCEGFIDYDCPSISANIGDPCDDGNANTIDDIISPTCECFGTIIPENDICSNAQVIVVNEPGECPDNQTIGTTIGASLELGEFSCDLGGDWVDVFYTFNSESFNSIQLQAADINQDDIVVEVSDGCAGIPIYCSFAISQNATLPVMPNTDYIIRVGPNTNVGSPGNFSICLSGVYDCPALSANIGDACDDGNANTINDTVSADCNCEGEVVGDGTLNGTVDWDANCASRNAVMHIYQAGTNSLVATHTFNVNPDGTFIIPIEDFGTFDVYFKVDGFLRTVVTNHVSALGANPIDFGTITPGDINGDNGVNVADVSGLIASFNSVIGDVNFNPLADLNCDGGVNIADASILNSSFNLTGVSLP